MTEAPTAMAELYPLLKSVWVVWFMALFLGVVWWATRPRRREGFDAAARIPLRED